MKRFSFAVFDLDGTLLDSLPDIQRVGNSLLRRYGLAPKALGSYRSAVGMGIVELYRRLLGPGTSEETVRNIALEAAEIHGRVEESIAAPFPGVQDMLHRLEAAGVGMALLSNKPRGAVEGSAIRFFPHISFQAVVGADGERPVKPDPGPVRNMLAGIGVKPEETAMVGDGEPDIRVALASGMFPLGCAWGFTPPDRLLRLGAGYLAGEPRDVDRCILGEAPPP